MTGKVNDKTSTNDTWCVLASQNWTGTDVYQVDCDVNPSDASCSNNGTGIDASSQRMANLYTDDLVSHSSHLSSGQAEPTDLLLRDSCATIAL